MSALLISGSTRSGSTCSAALGTIAAHRPSASLAVGLLTLPAFVPGAAEPAGLLDLLAAADLVLVCTPEYAGTLPGSLKNLLDWTVGSGVLSGRRCSWLDVAAPGRGGGALSTLRTVLGYVDAAVVEGASVFVGREQVGDDELVRDPDVVDALLTAYDRLVDG